MSLDAFIECKSCKQHMAALVWIQTFGSCSMAVNHGGGLDFLDALLPKPGALKIELCFGCQTFRPAVEFTPEEKADIQATKAATEESAKRLEKMLKPFDGLFGKK